MVDKSKNCTHVMKTKNIQASGGEVALIVNNDSRDPRDIVLEGNLWESGDVFIPTVIISKSDADIIKEFWRGKVKNSEETNIILRINFSMNQVGDDVLEKIELFFTSTDEKMYEFLRQFRYYYNELSKLNLY